MHSPEAVFDTLSIITELEPSFGRVTRLEVQRATYLACLLALYEGQPVADWGYRFARTEFGTPFSSSISDALDTLAEASLIEDANGSFQLSRRGKELTQSLGEMSNLSGRKRFLHAVCGSTIVVPAATLIESLDKEPTMHSALLRKGGAGLLDGPAIALLHEQFDALSQAVGVQGDLLTPAMIWLSYVAEQPVSRQDRGAES